MQGSIPPLAGKSVPSAGLLDPQPVGESGLIELLPTVRPVSLDRADELRARAERRADIPLRADFLRRDQPGAAPPPLARLVGTGGRGGGTPLKLYLGLVWIASAPPHSIPPIAARVWAELLDLDDPSGRGKRRVAEALDRLEEERLITVQRSRGEPSRIGLLHEGGDGTPYLGIPSTAYQRAADASERKRYFRVNTKLWTQGHIQSMSAKALGMLLVILEEQYGDHATPVWWSAQRFEDRFSLSARVRSEGGQELFRRRLIVIKRRPVSLTGSAFAPEKVRNTYAAIGPALPSNWREARATSNTQSAAP